MKKKPLTTNNLGKRFLVEQCEKISITSYLKQAREKLKETLINSQLELEGLDIELTESKTNYNGIRLWFKCPICNRRVGVIYKHPVSQNLGCRECLVLVYRSNRYKGMVENNIN